LPSFKSYAKEAFGEVGVILAKDLLEIKDIENFSKKIGLPVSKITILIKEAEMLSNGAAIVKSF
jgi:plasmid maintenance system antidote protein VapI